MKLYEFLCKFVDHDTKKCISVHIKMYCTSRIEWEESKVHEENLEGHKKWMMEHLEWEYALAEKAKNAAREELMKMGGGNYENYEIMKKKKSKEGKMINMNFGQKSDKIRYNKLFWMEFCMKKMVKGKKPDNWTDMFDYNKSYCCLTYNVMCKNNDPKQINAQLLTRIIDPSENDNGRVMAYGKDGMLEGKTETDNKKGLLDMIMQEGGTVNRFYTGFY